MENEKDFDRHEQLFLRCEFTEEELKGFSRELARATAQLSQAEEQKKAAMAQFAEQMTGQKALLSGLARKINEGYEMRNVDCGIKFDSPTRATATIIRLDTGEEVRQRAMFADELQQPLPLDEAIMEAAKGEAGDRLRDSLEEGDTATLSTGDGKHVATFKGRKPKGE